MEKFNTADSAGVLFLKLLNIPIGIITGENVKMVSRRADKLQVDFCFLGVRDKVRVAEELCTKLNIGLDEVAYIGDDINDILLLEKVGFSATPANAPSYIKEKVNFITTKNGGDGAFREFVEHILSQNGLMNRVLIKYMKSQTKLKQ